MQKLLVLAALFVVGFLHSPGAIAQSVQTGGEVDGCSNPQTQTEMNICAGEALRVADGDLNADYKMARDEMRRIDSDLPKNMRGAAKALLNGQRAWIKYRDGACNAEGFIFRGGTMEPLIVSTCKERLTRQRSEDLRKLFEKN